MLSFLWNAFIFYCLFTWIKGMISSSSNKQQSTKSRENLLRGMSGMFAKVAKADGKVSKEEVDIATNALKNMQLSEKEYRFCVEAFNYAVKAPTDVGYYARLFAGETSIQGRRLIYEILWYIAAADGHLDSGEDQMLRRLAGALGLGYSVYTYYRRLCTGGNYRYAGNEGYDRYTPPSEEDKLRQAYKTLGCSPTDSDAALKSAYRKQAMRYHPDRLRAEGLPEGMIAQATQTMAEINSAWDLIRKSRGI